MDYEYFKNMFLHMKGVNRRLYNEDDIRYRYESYMQGNYGIGCPGNDIKCGDNTCKTCWLSAIRKYILESQFWGLSDV